MVTTMRQLGSQLRKKVSVVATNTLILQRCQDNVTHCFGYGYEKKLQLRNLILVIHVKILHVKWEHVQASQIFSTLAQMMPNNALIYIRSHDMKKLTLEIATNVLTTVEV